MQGWRDRLPEGAEAVNCEIPCPDCGLENPPWGYDWREKAGFGRLFVQIEEVFPGEAVPTPGLLEILENSSGCAWERFYIQDA